MTTKTLKSAGGDFSTFAGWVAYLSASLSAPEQLDIYRKSGGYDEENAITGITTTNTNRLIINVPSAERGDGTPHSGAYLKNSTGGVLRIGANVDYVTIDGLEIDATGQNALAVNTTGTGGANQLLANHCFFHSTISTTNLGGSNRVHIWRNTIFYTDGSSRQFDPRGVASNEVSNCIFFNRGTDLGTICDTETTMKNTYSGGSSSADFWTGGGPTGNNNESSDTSATNRYPTGSVNSIAASSVFTSVTSGSENFTLKAGANSLVDIGATLAAVTDDFIGTARPQNSIYDVGAFERIASGGGTTRPFGMLLGVS